MGSVLVPHSGCARQAPKAEPYPSGRTQLDLSAGREPATVVASPISGWFRAARARVCISIAPIRLLSETAGHDAGHAATSESMSAILTAERAESGLPHRERVWGPKSARRLH